MRNDSAALDRVNSWRPSHDGESSPHPIVLHNHSSSSRISPLVRSESSSTRSGTVTGSGSPNFSLLQVSQSQPQSSNPPTVDRGVSYSNSNGGDEQFANITPLRSEISSLRGVLNTLTDHK